MGRNKLKRDSSEMLRAGVEVAPPAGSLTACLGSFHGALSFRERQGKQLVHTCGLICGHDMFTSFIISVIIDNCGCAITSNIVISSQVKSTQLKGLFDKFKKMSNK